MSWIPLVVLAAIIIFAVSIARLKQSRASEEIYPYTKNANLFSPAERSFLGVLQQAVGEEFTVLGKVRIADVASVKQMSDRKAWRAAFNRISAKHFDYLVCSRDNFSIVCAIELDDKSHQQKKRQERDSFVAGLCQSIFLPLLQVPAQRAYSIAEIRLKFLEAIKQPASSIQNKPAISPSTQVSISGATSASIATIVQPTLSEEPQFKDEGKEPLCPKCSSPMVQREIKTGARAGSKFWGCSTFPKCRGVTVGN
jgi:hypothetical protein